MTSITLKGIPDETMEALRALAERERRSLNQQAILLLEEALLQQRPGFFEAYDVFRREAGPSPLRDEDLSGLRDAAPGRSVAL